MDAITATEDLSLYSDEETELNETKDKQNQLSSSQKTIIDNYEKVVSRTELLLKELEVKRSVKEIKYDLKHQNNLINLGFGFQNMSIDQNQFQCYYDNIIMELNKLATNYIRLKCFDFSKVLLQFCRYSLQTEPIKSTKLNPALQVNILNNLGYCQVKQSSSTPFDSEIYFNQNESNAAMKYLTEARKIIEGTVRKDLKTALATNSLNFAGLYCSCFNDHKASYDYARQALVEFDKNIKRLEDIEISKSVEDVRRSSNEKIIKQHYKFLVKAQIKVADENFHLGNFQKCKEDYEKSFELIKKQFGLDSMLFKKYCRKYEKTMKKIGSKKEITANDHNNDNKNSSSQITPKFDLKNTSKRHKERPKSALQNRLINIHDNNISNFPLSEQEDNMDNIRLNKNTSLIFDSKSQPYTCTSRKLNKNVAHFNSNFDKIRTNKKGEYNIQTDKKNTTFVRSQQGYLNNYLNNNLSANSPNLNSAKNFEMNQKFSLTHNNRDLNYISRLREKMSNKIRSASGHSAKLFNRNTAPGNFRQNFLNMESPGGKNTIGIFSNTKTPKSINKFILDSDEEIQQNPMLLDNAFSGEEIEQIEKSEIEATMYYLNEEAKKKEIVTDILSEQINKEAEKRYQIESELQKLKKELYIRSFPRKNNAGENKSFVNRNESSQKMKDNIDFDQSERISRLEDLCRKLETQLLERHDTDFNSRSQSKTIKTNNALKDSHEKSSLKEKSKVSNKDNLIYNYELKLKQEQEKIKLQEEKLIKSSKGSKFKGEFSRSEIAIKLDEEHEVLETLENKLDDSNKKLILEEQRIKRMKKRQKNDKRKVHRDSEEKVYKPKDDEVNDYLKRMKSEMEKKLKKNIEKINTEFDSPGSNKKKDRQIIERQDRTDNSFSIALNDYDNRNNSQIIQQSYNQKDQIRQKYDNKKKVVYMHEDSNHLKRNEKEYSKENNQLSGSSIEYPKNFADKFKTHNSSSAIKILEDRLKTEEGIIKNLEQKLTKEFEDRIKLEYQRLNNEREEIYKKEESIKTFLNSQQHDQKKEQEIQIKSEYEIKLMNIEKKFYERLESKEQQMLLEKQMLSDRMKELEHRIKQEYEYKINSIETKIKLDYEEVLLLRKNDVSDKQTIEQMMLDKEKQRLVDRETYLDKEETRLKMEERRIQEEKNNLKKTPTKTKDDISSFKAPKKNANKTNDVRDFQMGDKKDEPVRSQKEVSSQIRTDKNQRNPNIEKNNNVGANITNSYEKTNTRSYVNQDTRITNDNESVVMFIENENRGLRETRLNNFLNDQGNQKLESIPNNALNNGRSALRQNTMDTNATEYFLEEKIRDLAKETSKKKELPFKSSTFVENPTKLSGKQKNIMSQKKVEVNDNLTITEDENESFISPDIKRNLIENTPLDVLADEMYSEKANNLRQNNSDGRTVSNFGEQFKFNNKLSKQNTKDTSKEQSSKNNNLIINSDCHKPEINKITDLNGTPTGVRKIDPVECEKSFRVKQETNHISKNPIKKMSDDDLKTTSYDVCDKPSTKVINEEAKTKKYSEDIKIEQIGGLKQIDNLKNNSNLAKSSVEIKNGEVIVKGDNDINAKRLKTDGNIPDKNPEKIVINNEGVKPYNFRLDRNIQEKKIITQKFRNNSTEEITQNYSNKKGASIYDIKKTTLSPAKSLMAKNSSMGEFQIYMNPAKRSKYCDLRSEIETMMNYDSISKENKENLQNLQVQAKSQEHTSYPKEEMKKLQNLEKEVEAFKRIKNKTKEDRVKLKEKSNQLITQAKFIKELKSKNKLKKDDLETKIRSKLDQINKSLLNNLNYSRSITINNDSIKVDKEMISRGNSLLIKMKENNNKKSQTNLIEDANLFKLIMKPIKIKMTNGFEINNDKDIYLKTIFNNKAKKTSIKKASSNSKSLVFDNKFITYRSLTEQDFSEITLELIIMENAEDETLVSRMEINMEQFEINKKNRRWWAGYFDSINNTELYIEMEMLPENSSSTIFSNPIEGPIVL